MSPTHVIAFIIDSMCTETREDFNAIYSITNMFELVDENKLKHEMNISIAENVIKMLRKI